ncbi:type II/IV secretion system protein [Patescibacteria group bacterium]|nr:type II/IV secretion system protein [Patescibacteria group bacterium]
MVKFDEEKQIQRIKSLHKKEEEELAQILSAKYGVEYIDLTVTSVNTDALKLIPEKEARDNKIAVFNIFDKTIKVAVLSPQNPDSQKTIAKLKEKGFEPIIYMVSNASLEKTWSRYKDISFSVKTEEGVMDITNETIDEFMREKKSIEDVQKVLTAILQTTTVNKISKFFDMITASAISLESSDIHIEPEENITRLRFRLDGILTNIIEFDNKTYNLILSRTKLTAGLKLNIKNNAQDGRFSIKMSDNEIEVRTSTMPGSYGESIVLRILNPKSIGVHTEKLGIEPHLLEVLMKEISKPNGMILNTGPTGSGKTTTLYSFLNKIYSSKIKIITIEDPIEYHIKGITQTQVDTEKGYTFAKGLKSALRQDPDVMLVGEIRDIETAEIAINSALTGHLVLSTLHTNTAAGTFPRFIDLGVNPKVLGSAINITMAQRLVRKLCSSCKKEVVMEAGEKKIIDKIVGGIFDKEKYPRPATDKIFKPSGCSECNNIGYKGRIGVYEAILVNEAIEDIITTNPSEREIRKVAKSQGLLDMKEDGVLKVLNGVTSLEELMRVIDLEEGF